MANTQFTLLGWLVLLIGLALLNKNKEGHTIIFYSLLLILLYLLVFNYRRLTGVLLKRG